MKLYYDIYVHEDGIDPKQNKINSGLFTWARAMERYYIFLVRLSFCDGWFVEPNSMWVGFQHFF